jgi:hypothetical protein
LALAAALLPLGGCIQYTLETTIARDGTGVRSEEMVVEEPDDTAAFRVAPTDFLALMNVSGEQGWAHASELRDGDTVHVFRRETRVGDPAAWSRLDGTVRIGGTVDRASGAQVGGVRLGDVEFRNTVQLEIGRGPEGRFYRYRERFSWTALTDVFIEQQLVRFRRALDARYPALDAERRGEVVGLVKGGLWSAIERGYLEMDDGERREVLSPPIARLSEQCARIVSGGAGADAEFFAETLRVLLVESDEEDERFLEQNLPGAALAANTEIVVRLRMPGTVVETNTDQREGDVLVWKFSPWDAAVSAVEVVAESREGG